MKALYSFPQIFLSTDLVWPSLAFMPSRYCRVGWVSDDFIAHVHSIFYFYVTSLGTAVLSYMFV